MGSTRKSKTRVNEDAAEEESRAGKVSSREAGLLLGTVCFFSGASVMVIEITGNRLLAPVFGNSLYTWTALIGVVLVAISAGGYLGGWLVDRSPSTKTLGLLLAAAAIATLVIPPVATLLQRVVGGLGLVSGPVVLSLMLFLVPGVLLGSITPFTIRLLSMVTGDTRIGSAAGVIGMLGTMGSFLGTFASGFFLIPRFGVRQIFLFTAVLLLLLAALVFSRFKTAPTKSGIMMLLGFAALGGALFVVAPPLELEGTIWSKLTFYHHIRVVDQQEAPGRTVRSLILDTTTEGGQILETGELSVAYQQYWKMAIPVGKDLENALFLGAGAFGMPQQLAKHMKSAHVDVVEIDPEVIRAGYECFGLRAYENIHPHAMDARRFLRTSPRQYDFVFADAYNGVRYIPAHLTTREFFEEAEGKLTERGVFLMNIISGLTGDRARLFQTIDATVRAVFDNVEVFSTSPRNYVVPHNILILAGNRDLAPFFRAESGALSPELRGLARSRVDPSVYRSEKGEVLTDDRNPVEYIVATELRRGEMSGEK